MNYIIYKIWEKGGKGDLFGGFLQLPKVLFHSLLSFWIFSRIFLLEMNSQKKHIMLIVFSFWLYFIQLINMLLIENLKTSWKREFLYTEKNS